MPEQRRMVESAEGATAPDADFTELDSRCRQPAFLPWKPDRVPVMPFVEDLADWQAADDVRGRIDRK